MINKFHISNKCSPIRWIPVENFHTHRQPFFQWYPSTYSLKLLRHWVQMCSHSNVLHINYIEHTRTLVKINVDTWIFNVIENQHLFTACIFFYYSYTRNSSLECIQSYITEDLNKIRTNGRKRIMQNMWLWPSLGKCMNGWTMKQK